MLHHAGRPSTSSLVDNGTDDGVGEFETGGKNVRRRQEN